MISAFIISPIPCFGSDDAKPPTTTQVQVLRGYQDQDHQPLSQVLLVCGRSQRIGQVERHQRDAVCLWEASQEAAIEQGIQANTLERRMRLVAAAARL